MCVRERERERVCVGWEEGAGERERQSVEVDKSPYFLIHLSKEHNHCLNN